MFLILAENLMILILDPDTRIFLLSITHFMKINYEHLRKRYNLF